MEDPPPGTKRKLSMPLSPSSPRRTTAPLTKLDNLNDLTCHDAISLLESDTDEEVPRHIRRKSVDSDSSDSDEGLVFGRGSSNPSDTLRGRTMGTIHSWDRDPSPERKSPKVEQVDHHFDQPPPDISPFFGTSVRNGSERSLSSNSNASRTDSQDDFSHRKIAIPFYRLPNHQHQYQYSGMVEGDKIVPRDSLDNVMEDVLENFQSIQESSPSLPGSSQDSLSSTHDTQESLVPDIPTSSSSTPQPIRTNDPDPNQSVFLLLSPPRSTTLGRMASDSSIPSSLATFYNYSKPAYQTHRRKDSLPFDASPTSPRPPFITPLPSTSSMESSSSYQSSDDEVPRINAGGWSPQLKSKDRTGSSSSNDSLPRDESGMVDFAAVAEMIHRPNAPAPAPLSGNTKPKVVSLKARTSFSSIKSNDDDKIVMQNHGSLYSHHSAPTTPSKIVDDPMVQSPGVWLSQNSLPRLSDHFKDSLARSDRSDSTPSTPNELSSPTSSFNSSAPSSIGSTNIRYSLNSPTGAERAKSEFTKIFSTVQDSPPSSASESEDDRGRRFDSLARNRARLQKHVGFESEEEPVSRGHLKRRPTGPIPAADDPIHKINLSIESPSPPTSPPRPSISPPPRPGQNVKQEAPVATSYVEPYSPSLRRTASSGSVKLLAEGWTKLDDLTSPTMEKPPVLPAPSSTASIAAILGKSASSSVATAGLLASNTAKGISNTLANLTSRAKVEDVGGYVTSQTAPNLPRRQPTSPPKPIVSNLPKEAGPASAPSSFGGFPWDQHPLLRQGKLVRSALRSSRHTHHYKKSLRFSDTGFRNVVLFEKHDVPFAVAYASPRYTAPDTDHLPMPKFAYEVIPTNLPPDPDLQLERGGGGSGNVVLVSLRRIDEKILVGDVNVRNLGFRKWVSVRYSLDFWKSFEDLPCFYLSPVENSPHLDRWSFHLDLAQIFSKVYDRNKESHRKLVRLNMEFCIRFELEGGQEWWDNNWGKNYEVELTRAPILLGTGLGIPGYSPQNTAPGPSQPRGSSMLTISPIFSAQDWMQPGTITPLWLTHPEKSMGLQNGSPMFGWTLGQYGPTEKPVESESEPPKAPPTPPPPPMYQSIFFDTSLFPHLLEDKGEGTVASTEDVKEEPKVPSVPFTFESHLPDYVPPTPPILGSPTGTSSWNMFSHLTQGSPGSGPSDGFDYISYHPRRKSLEQTIDPFGLSSVKVRNTSPSPTRTRQDSVERLRQKMSQLTTDNTLTTLPNSNIPMFAVSPLPPPQPSSSLQPVKKRTGTAMDAEVARRLSLDKNAPKQRPHLPPDPIPQYHQRIMEQGMPLFRNMSDSALPHNQAKRVQITTVDVGEYLRGDKKE